MVVTSAAGTYLPYSAEAKNGAVVPLALGLDGMDWNGRKCDPALSGKNGVFFFLLLVFFVVSKYFFFFFFFAVVFRQVCGTFA
jgi:hypothetical protein